MKASLLLVLVILIALTILEIKHIHQISDGRTVLRNVRIAFIRVGIREIVAAARSQRFQVPILFDEFQNGNVIRIGVVDMTALGPRRYDDERNPWPIAKEVK